MKYDRIDRTGSCGLVLLKHQVNSKQIVTEVRRKGVPRLLSSGIQAPRIPVGAADSFKNIFCVVCMETCCNFCSLCVCVTVGFNIYM